MESMLDLAVVPYRITSMASSVVRLLPLVLFNLVRMRSIDCNNMSEMTTPPLSCCCCVKEGLLHESKRTLSDEESSNLSLTISAADEKAWTEHAWTAKSIWERVSDNVPSNFLGGWQRMLSLLCASSAATAGAVKRNGAALPHTIVERKFRREWVLGAACLLPTLKASVTGRDRIRKQAVAICSAVYFGDLVIIEVVQ